MRGVSFTLWASCWFAAALAFAVAPAYAQGRPNILLIVADDLGLQLGSYGDRNITTPNIDRIGAEGVRFERAFSVQASCSSSRSSIYTGLYPHQNGQIGLSPPFSMSEPFPVLPTVLKQAGYRTGLIGKQHVAPEAAFDWDLRVADKDWVNWPYNTSDVALVEQEVEQFIRGSQSASVPFFLQVSLYDPHHFADGSYVDQIYGLPHFEELIDPNSIVWDYYRDRPFLPDQTEEAAHYYNAVKRLDIGVGMILAALDKAGIAENTLVIFTSDHNGSPGAIQGGKADIRDASNHVPLLIRFPAVRRQALVYDGLVSLIDLFPTVLEAAGNIPVPEPTASLMTDVRSLMPLVSGSVSGYRPRPAVFTEMTYHDENLYRPSRSIRTKDWHLIKYYPPFERGTGFVQLFDLRNDRLEYFDLSGDPAYNGTKEILLGWLSEWQRQTRGMVDPSGDVINLSTRGQVEASNVMHGGFVIRDAAKTVLIKALGPTLTDRGLTGTMSDPVLTLYRGQQVIAASDDWMTSGGCGSVELAPAHASEPCIMRTLEPGAYTAVVRGVGGSSGKAIISVNDMGGDGFVINLSTRGRVVPGVEDLTGGFVIRERNADVLVKALGPTLRDRGVAGTLPDPKLALYSGQNLIATNDGWQQGSCPASGMEPGYAVEPCVRATLGPGVYTAIVTSAGRSAGTAIVSINTIDE